MLDFIGNGLGAGSRANPARTPPRTTTANSCGQFYTTRQNYALPPLSPTLSSYSQTSTASHFSGNSFSIGQRQPKSYPSQDQVERNLDERNLFYRSYHQYVLDQTRTPQEPILSSLNSFFSTPSTLIGSRSFEQHYSTPQRPPSPTLYGGSWACENLLQQRSNFNYII